MSRPFIRSSFTLALTTLVLAGGCYANEEDDPGLYEFRDTFACITCTIGNNSPSVNDFPIPELSLLGQPTVNAITLVGIEDRSKVLHQLQVIDDEFVVDGPEFPLSGADLIGWNIVLDTPSDKELKVEIAGWDTHDSLANGGPPIGVYALHYTNQNNELVSVCPDVLPGAFAVTLIGGEVYDPEHKTVKAGQAGWFTLACEDEAVFKMKRMNYGPNADFDNSGLPATVAQRQAALKMITADYCGGGVTYTVQGTPIIWQDDAQTVGPNTVPANSVIESYWTDQGALCLDRPRFVKPTEVAEECTLPSCSTISPSDPRIIWQTHTP